MNGQVVTWAGAAALCLAVGGAMAGEYSMSADAEGTRGDYGSDRVSTVGSLTLGLQYQAERFDWFAAVPFLVTEAPSDVVVTGGMVQGGGRRSGSGGSGGSTTTATTRRESGLGDVSIGAGAVLLAESVTTPHLGLSGKVKFATADEERGLGTGANDYAVQLEAARSWINGRVGYRWLGNTATTDYRNVAYGALGLSRRSEAGGELGLEYLTEQASTDGGDSRQELTLYGSSPIGERTRLRGYLLKGFSDASPDFGAGVGIVTGL